MDGRCATRFCPSDHQGPEPAVAQVVSQTQKAAEMAVVYPTVAKTF
jgi:hypothetical protein